MQEGLISKLVQSLVTMCSIAMASVWMASTAGARVTIGNEPKLIWAKAGIDSAAMEVDFAACNKSAKDVVLPGDGPPDVASAGPVGNAFGSWLYSAIEQPKVRAHALKICMLSHGYHGIRLTSAEEMDLKAQANPAAAVIWTDQFYRRPDFDERLATDSPAPLPEAKDESFTFGAVRFDPASLLPASGAIGIHGNVLSGTVSHRQTARNLVDVRSDLNAGGYFAAGTIMHEAVFPNKDGSNQTFWCGVYNSLMEKTPACARNDSQGYVLVQPEGSRWVTTGIDVHGAPGTADPEAFHIVLSATDLLGPIGFSMSVRKLSYTSVALEAVVNQGNDFETLWQKTLTFDANGNAILPFWTHRLVLARTNKGVTVTFSADGDGKGWP